MSEKTIENIVKNSLYDENLIKKMILPITEINNAKTCVVYFDPDNRKTTIYYIPKNNFTSFHKKILNLFSDEKNWRMKIADIEKKINEKIPEEIKDIPNKEKILERELELMRENLTLGISFEELEKYANKKIQEENLDMKPNNLYEVMMVIFDQWACFYGNPGEKELINEVYICCV